MDLHAKSDDGNVTVGWGESVLVEVVDGIEDGTNDGDPVVLSKFVFAKMRSKSFLPVGHSKER